MLRFNTRLACQALGVLLLASSGIAQGIQLWSSDEYEPRGFAPLSGLVETYQELTSLQQEERNKGAKMGMDGIFVAGDCIVADVAASNAYSEMKNEGFEVLCSTSQPTLGTTTVLYFPTRAHKVMDRLRKGERVQFFGKALKIDGFSRIKRAHVEVTSFSDGAGPGAKKVPVAPAGVPAVPKLDGDMAQVRKQLIAAGWKPRPITPAPGAYIDASAKELQALGMPEAADCSGTGFAHCYFNYQKNGACLHVVSIGEFGGKSGPRYPSFDQYHHQCP